MDLFIPIPQVCTSHSFFKKLGASAIGMLCTALSQVSIHWIQQDCSTTWINFLQHLATIKNKEVLEGLSFCQTTSELKGPLTKFFKPSNLSKVTEWVHHENSPIKSWNSCVKRADSSRKETSLLGPRNIPFLSTWCFWTLRPGLSWWCYLNKHFVKWLQSETCINMQLDLVQTKKNVNRMFLVIIENPFTHGLVPVLHGPFPIQRQNCPKKYYHPKLPIVAYRFPPNDFRCAYSWKDVSGPALNPQQSWQFWSFRRKRMSKFYIITLSLSALVSETPNIEDTALEDP